MCDSERIAENLRPSKYFRLKSLKSFIAAAHDGKSAFADSLAMDAPQIAKDVVCDSGTLYNDVFPLEPGIDISNLLMV